MTSPDDGHCTSGLPGARVAGVAAGGWGNKEPGTGNKVQGCRRQEGRPGQEARQEEDARRRESARAATHFLETASWHELSWQRRLTPGLEQVVALAKEDPTVFEALVNRLGRELERVDPAARPGIGWSVVRVIEALEMERLFPTLEAKKAELVQAARKYHRERQNQPAIADKVISLASRWGARVAAR